MFRLDHIALVQFRNYLQQEWTFNERIIGICGRNGTGKTNLLDAIYYLSFSRSYFARPDSQNVHHGLQGLRLQGKYRLLEEPATITCILRENNRKELSLNDEAYKKFSDHIGRFPVVMIAPDDIELVTGPGEERRKFLDTLLSQLQHSYLQQLIDHSRLLQQRNGYLKQVAERGQTDEALFQIMDEQLAQLATAIYEVRHQFLQDFLPLVKEIYQRIAGKDDHINLSYESHLHKEAALVLLQRNRQKDLLLQRTTSGIHRDDLLITMDQAPFKSEASQGQRKSLLFALKLAEWQVLKDKKGFTPILLLDDVFEKLDEARMYQLLHWVCTESDGQVFISDTHPERLKQQLETIAASYQLIELA